MITVMAIAGLIFACIPLAMFFANMPLFCDANETSRADGAKDGAKDDSLTEVSVLVPARDEAVGIEACIQAAIASEAVSVEIVVLDDHSTDDTAQIVQSLSQKDPRVRLVAGAELPPDWNGKQHACKQLAVAAKYERLVFIDADVRLKPGALAKLVARQDQTDVALLSAFPYQETETILEKCLIPMMHFILLGFLPFRRMRGSNHPAYASGCGQLFMTKQAAYTTAGTHEAIRGSRHDGLKLPKAYRQAGLSTDVIDGSDLADCRMYTSAGEVIRGVLKNASEGIANARLIIPFTVLLLGGTLLPLVAIALAWRADHALALRLAAAALLVGHVPRMLAAVHFRQSWTGVLLHSFATILFVALQWTAFAMSLLGKSVAWRGRV